MILNKSAWKWYIFLWFLIEYQLKIAGGLHIKINVQIEILTNFEGIKRAIIRIEYNF